MKEEILKAKIRERYGKIALSVNSDCCCTSQECNSVEFNPKLSSISIGYNDKELEAIPETSILGVGCGAPLNFANLKEGETVVDLGSGAGILKPQTVTLDVPAHKVQLQNFTQSSANNENLSSPFILLRDIARYGAIGVAITLIGYLVY